MSTRLWCRAGESHWKARGERAILSPTCGNSCRSEGNHMTYFVTGATGFIGRHLLAKLLARKGEVYCLVRKGSQEKFEELRARFGADGKRLHAVSGDLAKASLGVSPAQRRALGGRIKHFFHL